MTALICIGPKSSSGIWNYMMALITLSNFPPSDADRRMDLRKDETEMPIDSHFRR